MWAIPVYAQDALVGDANLNGNGADYVDMSFGVVYTITGDAGLDGQVNPADLGALAANFGGSSGSSGLFSTDNFAVLAEELGKSDGSNADVTSAADFAALQAFEEANGLTASIPEPASLGLLAIGSLGLLARRRAFT